jgi:hypothetical protein
MPDIHFECAMCKQSLEAPEELANQLIDCPTCKETIEVPIRSRPPQSLIQSSSLPSNRAPSVSEQTFRPPAASLQSDNSRQSIPYAVKVLTTKDRFFSGKFDPEILEAALNSYAAEGWTVAGCDSAEFPGLFGSRSELVSVLHKLGGRMKKYKVLTQKDRFFGGKFDPDRLESAINSYVPEGWQVRAVTTASFPGFGSNREEMIVILERDV